MTTDLDSMWKEDDSEAVCCLNSTRQGVHTLKCVMVSQHP
jgi:hypothetical protein